jgi:hypothetical protein
MIKEIPFRIIWIFFVGWFSALYFIAVGSVNLEAQMLCGIGIIVSLFLSIVWGWGKHDK